jgi:hypothetical protein
VIARAAVFVYKGKNPTPARTEPLSTTDTTHWAAPSSSRCYAILGDPHRRTGGAGGLKLDQQLD